MANTIKRTFIQRGEEVNLDEVAGAVAIREASQESVATKRSRGASLSAGGRPDVSISAMPLAEYHLTASSMRAFANAGWRIVPRAHDDDGYGRKIYRRENGDMVLSTNRLIVQLPPSMPEDEAMHLLSTHRLIGASRLPFGSNLFIVVVPAGKDPVEAAQELAASHNFNAAEPEFIEVLGHRSTGSRSDSPRRGSSHRGMARSASRSV